MNSIFSNMPYSVFVFDNRGLQQSRIMTIQSFNQLEDYLLHHRGAAESPTLTQGRGLDQIGQTSAHYWTQIYRPVQGPIFQ